MSRIEELLDAHDARREARSTHDDRLRLRGHRPGHRRGLAPMRSAPARSAICSISPAPSRVHEMQRMAVEESRLRIPLLFGLDVIHGYRTLFPVPLAEAALLRSAGVGSYRARGGARGGARRSAHDLRADARRVARPALGPHGRGSRRGSVGRRAPGARPRCVGFQGRRSAAAGCAGRRGQAFLSPTARSLAGREYASVDISERTLREVHLPPFDAAVDAGVAAVMPAFTDLAGMPMTAHERAAARLAARAARLRWRARERLQRDRRAAWSTASRRICAEAAALALSAGVDIDMMSDAYRHGLPMALERGLVAIAGDR